LMAYSFPSCPARFDPGTLQRHHPSTSEVVYVLGPTVQSAADIERHQRAIDALNTATGNAPRYVIATAEPVSGVIVRVSVDPQKPSCTTGSAAAYAVVHGVNRYITGADVVYCANSYASNPRTIAHELGHTVGLNHSDATTADDLMSCTYAEAPAVFSPREALLIRLMLLRPGGKMGRFISVTPRHTAVIGVRIGCCRSTGTRCCGFSPRTWPRISTRCSRPSCGP
jgi:hypothetical protein